MIMKLNYLFEMIFVDLKVILWKSSCHIVCGCLTYWNNVGFQSLIFYSSEVSS